MSPFLRTSPAFPQDSAPAVVRPVIDARGSLRRTLTFVAALGGMLGLARSGQSTLVVWLTFGVFVSVATVWVRGQYVDSLDGRQWVIPYRIGWWLTAGAAALLLAGFADLPKAIGRHARGLDGELLAIIGVVLIYLVAGSALTQVRQIPRPRFLGREIRTGRWSIGLTAAGLALAIAGVGLLRAGRFGLAWPMIGSGVLALMPIGMALWSEQAIRRACARGRARAWLWGLGGAGAVLFATASAIAFWVIHSLVLVVFLVVLGLFIVAMVSTTQAGIAVVLAAMALMGVTPAQRSNHRLHPRPGQQTLLALGDSYMSGEGASVFYKKTDDGGFKRKGEGQRNECRRAPSAWPELVVQTDDSWLKSLACSGAVAGDVAGQITVFRSMRLARPSMVVLSIGGNDAGFASLGMMCLAPGNCAEKGDMWLEALKTLPGLLKNAYTAVNEAFPGTPVVVVPYPDPIYTKATKCDQVTLSPAERKFIQRFIDELSATISKTAEEFRFYYAAEMRYALLDAHLQLCDKENDGRPGVNFIGLRSVHGTAMQRFNPMKWVHSSLHPNERGHAAMARAFQSWRSGQAKVLPARRNADKSMCGTADRKSVTACRRQPDRQEGGASTRVTTEPPCDLLDEKASTGCKKKAWRWAIRQVGDALIGGQRWLLIVSAAAGAWLVAVAFFAYRRRVHAACG